MTAARIENTRQCPFCKAWIPLPVRHPIQAFNAHKSACLQSQAVKA